MVLIALALVGLSAQLGSLVVLTLLALALVLTVQKPATAGVAQTMAACTAGGDSFPNTGKEWVLVTNANAAARTLTFDSPNTCSFGLAAHAAHDQVVIVAGLTSQIIGPFPTGRFNDPNGRVQITYSDAAADLTIAVMSTE